VHFGFREADYSEMHHAEEVARINRTDHHTEIVDADSLALLPTLARHYGQPFADSSAIPTFHVSRMARKFVKMVLSGDGGDENFAGYHSYEYVVSRLVDARTPHLPGAKRRWWRELAGLTYRRLRRASFPQPLVDQIYEQQAITAHHFSPGDRRRLWRPPYRHLVHDVDRGRRAWLDVADAPVVTRLQHLDLMTYLPFDILTKVDIAAMANSLEVRVPLLDHHLVELAATMPAELKLAPTAAGYEKKYALKQLAARRYPATLIDRPKMGFGVPIGEWMAGPLRGEVEQRLLRSADLPVFFDMDEVGAIWRRHLERRDMTAKVWNLLFLGEWLSGHRDVLPAR